LNAFILTTYKVVEIFEISGLIWTKCQFGPAPAQRLYHLLQLVTNLIIFIDSNLEPSEQVYSETIGTEVFKAKRQPIRLAFLFPGSACPDGWFVRPIAMPFATQ
jgi:hypothetical protein